MKYEQMCREILPLVGGRENITNCYNCMTRLRLVLADLEKADLEALKKFYLSGWIEKTGKMEYAKETPKERISMPERG